MRQQLTISSLAFFIVPMMISRKCVDGKATGIHMATLTDTTIALPADTAIWEVNSLIAMDIMKMAAVISL